MTADSDRLDDLLDAWEQAAALCPDDPVLAAALADRVCVLEAMAWLADTPTSDTVFAGRFRLERLVGFGGQACVWAAHDLTLVRRVAVK